MTILQDGTLLLPHPRNMSSPTEDLPRSLNALQISYAYHTASYIQFTTQTLDYRWAYLRTVLIDSAMRTATFGSYARDKTHIQSRLLTFCVGIFTSLVIVAAYSIAYVHYLV